MHIQCGHSLFSLITLELLWVEFMNLRLPCEGPLPFFWYFLEVLIYKRKLSEAPSTLKGLLDLG